MPDIEILYQDEDLCVVNKPAGFVVHRTQGASKFPVLLQTLRDQLGKKLFPVHRLDRGTSGCLAFAFSSEGAKKLQENLQSEASTKEYQALCLGRLPAEGVFDRDLTSENGVKQSALTKFQVIQEFEKYTLLNLQIFTGRRHQIRRHLSFEGHHIIGDVQHGKGWLNRRFRDEYDFHRMFLHCHRLAFQHPTTSLQINLKCDLEVSLQRLLTNLH